MRVFILLALAAGLGALIPGCYYAVSAASRPEYFQAFPQYGLFAAIAAGCIIVCIILVLRMIGIDGTVKPMHGHDEVN